MDKKSTSIDYQMMEPTDEYHRNAKKMSQSPAGSPRESTLELLCRFARCYHFDSACAVAAGIILN